MKRIVKMEGVGNVVFPGSMSHVEVSQAGGRLYDDANATLTNVPQLANDLKRPDASPPTPSKPVPEAVKRDAVAGGTHAHPREEKTTARQHTSTRGGRQMKNHPAELE